CRRSNMYNLRVSNEHVGKRILGRIRLSREAEDAGTSESRQREAIEAWTRMHGATVIGWAVDLGVSGGTDPFETPELGPWLKPERLIEWDVLVGYRLDRISRRLVPLSKLMDFLKDEGKSLASTSESIDLSTWSGRLVATVLAIVAEGELEAATERNQGSQKKIRELGRLHSGVVPYGYRSLQLSAGDVIWGDNTAETAGWYAVIDPDQADVIRTRMVAPLLAHKSTNSIATDLNTAGVPSNHEGRTRKLKSGETVNVSGRWDSTVVRRILSSPTLMGYGVHKGETITDADGVEVQRAEPILTRQEFDQVQAALKSRAIRQSPRDQSTNLLAGVAFCWHCKGPLYRQVYSTRNVTYYRCPKANGKNSECRYRNVRAEKLYEHAETTFLEVIGDLERQDKVFVPASDHTEALERVKVALTTVRRENELGLYDGTPDEYLDRVQRLVDRKKRLELLPAEPARFEYRGLGETYAQAWERMNIEERRGLMIDAGFKVWAGSPLEIGHYLPIDIRIRVQYNGISPELSPEEIARLQDEFLISRGYVGLVNCDRCGNLWVADDVVDGICGKCRDSNKNDEDKQ
ncbi:recombinase family protein, partial [Nocardia sp. NPDC059246]|uniref:recombinase family protein n=1 Tax=unclassified Nocardia TaxID=2637762 RepID=UPI0036A34E20